VDVGLSSLSPISEVPISGSVRYHWSRISDLVPSYAKDVQQSTGNLVCFSALQCQSLPKTGSFVGTHEIILLVTIDFPSMISNYSLVIKCGFCVLASYIWICCCQLWECPCLLSSNQGFLNENRVPWRLRHPTVGHCDTPTRTIRHCNDSPHVVLRPCDPTSAIRLDSGFFVQGVFLGA
jgi:hypothetical protein